MILTFVHASVRNFGCPCARDNQTSRRTTKKTDAVVRRTTINFDAQAVRLKRSHVRTTKNLEGQPEIVTWLSMGQPFIFP